MALFAVPNWHMHSTRGGFGDAFNTAGVIALTTATRAPISNCLRATGAILEIMETMCNAFRTLPMEVTGHWANA